LSHCPTPTAQRITRRRWLVVGQYGAATTDARPRSYRPRPRGPASPPAPTRGTLVGPRIAGRPAWPDRPGSRPVRCSRPGRRARGSLEDTPTGHASRWRRGLERACASPFPPQQTRNPLRSVGLVARRAAVPAVRDVLLRRGYSAENALRPSTTTPEPKKPTRAHPRASPPSSPDRNRAIPKATGTRHRIARTRRGQLR
jgi:hypothetical protein